MDYRPKILKRIQKKPIKVNYLKVMKERCLLCTCCASVCPNSGIDITENEVIFNENCTECKICVKSCPVGAIE